MGKLSTPGDAPLDEECINEATELREISGGSFTSFEFGFIPG